MKKTQIAKWTFRVAKRNPRLALSAALFAVERWDTIARTLRISRGTSRAVSKAAEPGVRNDLRAAGTNLSEAFARARKVGVVNALGDRRVAKSTHKGLGRASTALVEVKKATRPPHKLRHALIGAGLLAGGYRAWKRISTPGSPRA